MTTRSLIPACIAVALWLSACDQRELLRKLTPEADDKLSRQFLDAVIRKQASEAMPLLTSENQTPTGAHGLEQLIGLFRGGAVESIEVIGAHRHASLTGGKTVTSVQLSYQLHLSSGWFAGVIVIVDSTAGRRILSARFNPLRESLERTHALTFSGKGAAHYVFLLLAVLIPVFCIATLVICARSRIRRKWAWILFILFGLVSVKLNWTTGEIGYSIVSFQLLGASAVRPSFYAPWIIGISVPVGALIFLLSRKDLITKAAPHSGPPPLVPVPNPPAPDAPPQ